MIREKEKGMSLIVKTVTRLTVGAILLYGIYIVLHGHVSPGGGFAGGVIIALSFVHLVLALGKEAVLKKVSENASSVLESVGALIFISIALLGLGGGYFLYNFLGKGRPFNLFSAGIIPLLNIAICLKVGMGLFAVFVTLAVFKTASEDK